MDPRSKENAEIDEIYSQNISEVVKRAREINQNAPLKSAQELFAQLQKHIAGSRKSYIPQASGPQNDSPQVSASAPVDSNPMIDTTDRQIFARQMQEGELNREQLRAKVMEGPVGGVGFRRSQSDPNGMVGVIKIGENQVKEVLFTKEGNDFYSVNIKGEKIPMSQGLSSGLAKMFESEMKQLAQAEQTPSSPTQSKLNTSMRTASRQPIPPTAGISADLVESQRKMTEDLLNQYKDKIMPRHVTPGLNDNVQIKIEAKDGKFNLKFGERTVAELKQPHLEVLAQSYKNLEFGRESADAVSNRAKGLVDMAVNLYQKNSPEASRVQKLPTPLPDISRGPSRK